MRKHVGFAAGVAVIVAVILATGCVEATPQGSSEADVQATIDSSVAATVAAVTGTPASPSIDPETSSAPTPTLSVHISDLPFDELKSRASLLTYDDLFRNNDSHVGSLVYFRAKVVQAIDGGSDRYQLRADVTQAEFFWEDTVFLHYVGPRLLEQDIIEFVGRVQGLLTYEAVLGNSITLPEIDVIQARLVSVPTSASDLTATPTPLTGLARTRPAPRQQVVRVEDEDNREQYAIRVVEVKRGAEAATLVTQANMFNDPPSGGSEFLLVYVIVDYMAGPQDESKRLSSFDVDLVTAQGAVLGKPFIITPEPEFGGEVYPGAAVEGWLAWEVPLGSDGSLIRYSPFRRGATAWLRTD